MIKYKKGYKYQLYETYSIKTGIKGYFIQTDFLLLDRDGNLVIRKGYAWDGASGIPDTQHNMRASLIHDALYQLMRMGLLPLSYKEAADQIFAHVCKEAGMLEEFSYLMYEGVNKLGFIGLREERPVLTAP